MAVADCAASSAAPDNAVNFITTSSRRAIAAEGDW